MEVKILKDEKENLLIEMNNQTAAELLRVYLSEEDSVVLAAWKKLSINDPITFELKTKGKVAKKVLEEVIAKIEKETDKISEEFKKSLK